MNNLRGPKGHSFGAAFTSTDVAPAYSIPENQPGPSLSLVDYSQPSAAIITSLVDLINKAHPTQPVIDAKNLLTYLTIKDPGQLESLGKNLQFVTISGLNIATGLADIAAKTPDGMLPTQSAIQNAVARVMLAPAGAAILANFIEAHPYTFYPIPKGVTNDGFSVYDNFGIDYSAPGFQVAQSSSTAPVAAPVQGESTEAVTRNQYLFAAAVAILVLAFMPRGKKSEA